MVKAQCYNVICPQCKLTWLVPVPDARLHLCLNCTYFMFDKYINEYLQSQNQHGAIYSKKHIGLLERLWAIFS